MIRAIAITQNGITSYAPYNEKTISFYEERNKLIIGTRKEKEETVTLRIASPEEVQTHILAEKVNTVSNTAVHSMQSGISEIDQMKSLYVSQQAHNLELQNKVDRLEALLNTLPVPVPVSVPAPFMKARKNGQASPNQPDLPGQDPLVPPISPVPPIDDALTGIIGDFQNVV